MKLQINKVINTSRIIFWFLVVDWVQIFKKCRNICLCKNCVIANLSDFEKGIYNLKSTAVVESQT